MEDIKEKIEEVVNKIKNDEGFANKFKEDPIKAVKSVLGIDLPEEKINEIITAVKAKVNLDGSGLMDKIKGLF